MSFSAPRSDDPGRPDADPGEVVGPEIRDLFDLTRPQEPTASEWDRVNQIVGLSLPQPGSSWPTVALSLAAGVMLAVGVTALWHIQGKPQPGPAMAREDADNSLDEYAELPLATEDDVEIHRIRGNGLKAAVIGKSQFSNDIVWAGPKDIRIKSSIPDEIFGSEPKMYGGDQNMPVIWADDSND